MPSDRVYVIGYIVNSDKTQKINTVVATNEKTAIDCVCSFLKNLKNNISEEENSPSEILEKKYFLTKCIKRIQGKDLEALKQYNALGIGSPIFVNETFICDGKINLSWIKD